MRSDDPLAIEIERAGDAVTVKLAGELDLSNAGRLRGVLATVADAREIAVDLAGVTFMDSTGLSALVHQARHLRAPQRLVVVAPQPAVRRLFAITELDRVLTIVDER